MLLVSAFVLLSAENSQQDQGSLGSTEMLQGDWLNSKFISLEAAKLGLIEQQNPEPQEAAKTCAEPVNMACSLQRLQGVEGCCRKSFDVSQSYRPKCVCWTRRDQSFLKTAKAEGGPATRRGAANNTRFQPRTT
jgi:hypothetical protein